MVWSRPRIPLAMASNHPPFCQCNSKFFVVLVRECWRSPATRNASYTHDVQSQHDTFVNKPRKFDVRMTDTLFCNYYFLSISARIESAFVGTTRIGISWLLQVGTWLYRCRGKVVCTATTSRQGQTLCNAVRGNLSSTWIFYCQTVESCSSTSTRKAQLLWLYCTCRFGGRLTWQ